MFDSVETKPNGWTGQYFRSVQFGNPLMASIQGAPWQVRGTDPASSYDTLEYAAGGMQTPTATPAGLSLPSLPDWFPDWLKSIAIGGTGVFVGLALLVVGLIFFLKD